MVGGVGCPEREEIYTVFGRDSMRGTADGARLLNLHLARTVPQHRVIVLVQRFFLLDTDGLRADGLGRFGEVFPETFVALAIYLVANRLPYLHQGAGKIERVDKVTRGDPSQRHKVVRIQGITHAETSPMINVAKYSGLNRIAMASFQPNTTNTAYIQ